MRPVFFGDIVTELICELKESFSLGFLFIFELLWRCVDKPLLGAFLGISDEQVYISMLHLEHFSEDKALSIKLVKCRETVLSSFVV